MNTDCKKFKVCSTLDKPIKKGGIVYKYLIKEVDSVFGTIKSYESSDLDGTHKKDMEVCDASEGDIIHLAQTASQNPKEKRLYIYDNDNGKYDITKTKLPPDVWREFCLKYEVQFKNHKTKSYPFDNSIELPKGFPETNKGKQTRVHKKPFGALKNSVRKML